MSTRIDILSIFPEMVKTFFSCGVVGKAISKGLVDIRAHNIRDGCRDKHRTTDDYPFGGGSGMVMKIEPIVTMLERVTGNRRKDCHCLLLSPQGKVFSQKEAKRLASLQWILLICGRYEGIDERVRENFVDEEISIGDYILSGGESAAMVVIEAVLRLIPGVLGNEYSTQEESFQKGLLEYPQYTRPRVFRKLGVPEVLLSGNHDNIKRWRRKKALEKTRLLRPDLFEKFKLSKEDEELLQQDNSTGGEQCRQ